MENADGKKVRFNPEIQETQLTGRWSFLRYLLTLNEEINIQIITDTLEDRGALTPTQKDEVLQHSNYREKTEKCLEVVMTSSPDAYGQFCEVLKDCGYNHVVESLTNDLEYEDDSISKYTLTSEEFYEKTAKELGIPWGEESFIDQTNPGNLDNFAVVGVKMSLNSLSKDTKASQREVSTIMQRQEELEKQLGQVMKTLDNAKEALIKERQEKAFLHEQLIMKDSEINEVERKYRDLQNAVGRLKDSNNKFHERVTKLQIENDHLRKTAKDKTNLNNELNQKHIQIHELKRTIDDQEKQLIQQESMIHKKLSVVEQLALDHQKLLDGQNRLENLITKQSDQITRLKEEKDEAHRQMSVQQKQLSSQQACMAMLQEQLDRLEMNVMSQSEKQSSVISIHPSENSYRGKRQPSTMTSKPLLVRPLNTNSKHDPSKSLFWKNSGDYGRSKQK